jgi:DNA replication protein DnaC
VSGRPLTGTGVWRSQLTESLCPVCIAALENERRKKLRLAAIRRDHIELLGGEKPYREFTFEKFIVTPGNRLAYERSRQFNPVRDNLYFWGPCGVGKTHLAWAIARRCFEETMSVEILRAWQLSRQVRMKDPDREQAAIDQFIKVETLVLDELGAGLDSAFSRQILQEILDGRDYNDRAGLVITSKNSLDNLAARLADDTIPSRLAGMCRTIEIIGHDHRLHKPQHG